MLHETIGIIGGTGWIGGSFAKRFLETQLISPSQLTVSNRSGEHGDLPQDVMVTTDVQLLADQSDVIVLSVRPTQLAELNVDIGDQLVISVMAGTSFEAIHAATSAQKIVRCMPNAGCLLGQSLTPYFANDNITKHDIELTEKVLHSVGETMRVDSERALNFLTGLSGSAPGMLTFYENAYIKAAERFGFSFEEAEKIVRQTFAGACAFIAHDHEDPRQAMKTMLDYNGTTAAGIQSLIDAGIEEAIIDSVNKAFERSNSDMSQSA